MTARHRRPSIGAIRSRSGWQLLLLLALVVLTSCGIVIVTTAVPTSATTGITSSMRSLTISGTQRAYLTVAPVDQDEALPLLVVLHGRAISVQDEEIRTDFLPLTGQRKAVLVYPVGDGQSWNSGAGCCGEAGAAHVDDSTFLAAVISDVARHVLIDGSRVYLVGYSNGARMAFTEVCAHPSLFAAFAVYGAVPPETCGDSSVTVPALISAGTADPELSTANPVQTTTQVIESVVARWRARDGCGITSTSAAVTTAQLTLWAHCRNGSAVESVLYNGLRHDWPRATHTNIPSNTAVGTNAAAATLMWAFLSTHRSTRT